MDLLIATHNKHKITEFQRILSKIGINVVTAEQIGINDPGEITENGLSFEENAMIKAKAFAKSTNMPCIADDSGLCVHALGGIPGVFSARFGGENLSSEERYKLLLKKMEGIPEEKRSAHFACSICCVLPNGDTITSTGICNGYIGTKPYGDGGFGYDPVFYTKDGRSFASLTDEEKDAVSHRGLALREFAIKINEYINQR